MGYIIMMVRFLVNFLLFSMRFLVNFLLFSMVFCWVFLLKTEKLQIMWEFFEFMRLYNRCDI